MSTDDQNKEKKWRLIDVLKEAAAFLETRGIDNSRLNAEQLLGHVLGLKRIDLYLQFEKPISLQERETYKTLLLKRASHEPLQYILGETEFMSLSFKVTPDVLIPRPETETLVEKIVEEAGGEKQIKILDIGTGSGNIAISLSKYMTGAKIVAVDTNDKILSIARENAALNDVEGKIEFIKTDIREKNFCQVIMPPFDLVVSNPPYVSEKAWEVLPEEIRRYEPKDALYGGADGFFFFRAIGEIGKEILTQGGKLFLEVGDGQSEEVETILRKIGYQNVKIFPDLNGIDRVVRGVLIS